MSSRARKPLRNNIIEFACEVFLSSAFCLVVGIGTAIGSGVYGLFGRLDPDSNWDLLVYVGGSVFGGITLMGLLTVANRLTKVGR